MSGRRTAQARQNGTDDGVCRHGVADGDEGRGLLEGARRSGSAGEGATGSDLDAARVERAAIRRGLPASKHHEC
jgi:hypothetical protein